MLPVCYSDFCYSCYTIEIQYFTDYNRLKANPDPAMKATTVQQTTAPKGAPAPVVSRVEEKLELDVLDENPIELELNPETFAI